ncbi:MAG TPA: tRNA preQ1(34) S-adenosylmethionine ribosyltransferase-isomerase QueA [Pyrinomonadaceae bacterium]|jgi:S-adenosylmethionine:tRNA ribosyltransferase-isomerase
MRLSDFAYELPERLIAQEPATPRDASRMLVVNRAEKTWQDAHFLDFPSFVQANDAVVLNNTKVFPARLIGEKKVSGGRVELFLIREREPGIWEALVKPARRFGVGARIKFGTSSLGAEVIQCLEEGLRLVKLQCEGSLEQELERVGQTPLPPYIKRPGGSSPEDRKRYQTVYARRRGAIAAPTAGLHFTPGILDEVTARQARLIEITLHVGYGTFEPIRVDEVDEHSVAPERYEISQDAATTINQSQACGGRVMAIGTTTARAVESAVDDAGQVHPRNDFTWLTIRPGYRFRAVEVLLTNFHLPQSSLLVLVAAFAGRDLVLQAYRHAVAAEYRFYSYGDCMLII